MFTDGPEYETLAGVGSNCGIFDPVAVSETNFYCDTYGIDTISFGTLCAFVMECYERYNKQGDNRGTGAYFRKLGSSDGAVAPNGQGEGFGVVAGQGVHRMKSCLSRNTCR